MFTNSSTVKWRVGGVGVLLDLMTKRNSVVTVSSWCFRVLTGDAFAVVCERVRRRVRARLMETDCPEIVHF